MNNKANSYSVKRALGILVVSVALIAWSAATPLTVYAEELDPQASLASEVGQEAPGETDAESAGDTTEDGTAEEGPADGSPAEEAAPEELPKSEQDTIEPEATHDDELVLDENVAEISTEAPTMVDDGTYVIKAGTGTVLDVDSGSSVSGANVQTWSSNGTDAQRWYVKFDRDESSEWYGSCTISNLGSSLALDVDSGVAKSGRNVQQWSPNGTAAQRWRLKASYNGTALAGYFFLSAIDPAYALDVAGASASNGANVQIYRFNGSKAQTFELIDSASVPGTRNEVIAYAASHADDLPEGTYIISSEGTLRRVADVESGSSANCANVRLWDYNASAAQSWAVSDVRDIAGTTWKILKNVGSGKVLDVASGVASKGTNVQQYSYNGSKAQLWAAVKNANGTYTFWSALGSGLVLDLASGSTAQGTNLQLWSSNGTAAQRFALTSTAVEAPASDADVAEDLYTLYIGSSSNCMDVASGSSANGAAVQAYAYNGTLAQGWQLSRDASGYWRLYSTCSNKALDLDSGDLLPGGKVQQWSALGNLNQLWALQNAGDGLYRLVSRASGLALGVSSSGTLTTVTPSTNAILWRMEAYAPSLSEGYYTLSSNAASSQVVDVPSGSWSSGLALATYASNGTLAQKWYVRRLSNGTYTIQNVGSGLYIGEHGTSIVQTNKGASTAWMLGFTHEQGLTLTSAASGLLLSVPASPQNSTALTPMANPAQKCAGWMFSTTSLNFSSGYYELAPAVATGMRLDVSSGSSVSGANVQIWQSNGTASQKWWLEALGNSWYTLFSGCGAKALDVAGASKASGTNVQQWLANGSDAQKWRFEMGEFGLKVVSALGTVLDVFGAGKANGTNVDAYTYNGTAAQAWHLSSTSWPTRIELDVPYLNQYEEGARMGCEGISLYMALRYQGKLQGVSYRDFQASVPMSPDGNPNNGFVGSPWTYTGNIDGELPAAVASWGSQYASCTNISGCSKETLVSQLTGGRPVVVWTSVNFTTNGIGLINTWYGQVPAKWHVMVLTGYDSATGAYKVNDPASNSRRYWVSASNFESVWNIYRGAVAVGY